MYRFDLILALTDCQLEALTAWSQRFSIPSVKSANADNLVVVMVRLMPWTRLSYLSPSRCSPLLSVVSKSEQIDAGKYEDSNSCMLGVRESCKLEFMDVCWPLLEANVIVDSNFRRAVPDGNSSESIAS